MFQIIYNDKNSYARTGLLKTSHGNIQTPIFLPVVTKGAGKYLTFRELEELNTQMFISNAFLLSLKPGLSILKQTKGYHNFINWKKPIITDSGGFQGGDPTLFVSLNEQGLKFRSPFNGDLCFYTPEDVVKINKIIGSDIMMVLDDMLTPNHTKKEFKKAVDITIDWAQRSLKAHNLKTQQIFGIVQGGVYKDLRKECALSLNNMPFDGIGIGGLAIGEPKPKMYKAIDASLPEIDKNKFKYLMGVGSPEDILECISRGIDCFDSVYPTRMARHGVVFTKNGSLKIYHKNHECSFIPIDKTCDCYTCRNHTRAYLHHLYRIKEPNAMILLSIHNIRFMHKLTENARTSIKKNQFEKFKTIFLKDYLENSK